MRSFIAGVFLFVTSSICFADAASPAIGKLPHIEVDVQKKEVRVACTAVKADYPLEFLVVQTNTNEYEAIVSTDAKPSDLHLALLMIGLKPGQPIRYSDSTKTWLPPLGPPVQLWFEYDKDGKHEKMPAYRWMRDVKTKKAASSFAWVFTGSKTLDDKSYGADATGFLVSVINNELAVLDVPSLKSRGLESRELERNPDIMPPTGTPVTLILTPAGANDTPTAGQSEATSTSPTTQPLSDVRIDQEKVDHLQDLWKQKVAPHKDALQEAAQAHYEVIAQLRHEQQRLIDEADRIQRAIDQLEKDYQDMTTPRPEQ